MTNPTHPYGENSTRSHEANSSHPVGGDARRAGTRGGGFFIAFALGFYGLYLSLMLVKSLVHSEIIVRFDFEGSARAPMDLGGHSAELSGLTPVTLSTGDLATETVVFLLIGKIGFILTLFGAAIVLIPVIRAIAKGDPFTAGSLKAFSVLSWILAIGFVLYFFGTLFGSNLASRDLGIADDVGPSVSFADNYVMIGVFGVLEILRRSFVSGRRAQDELEGLV